jgi:hypothetical protein
VPWRSWSHFYSKVISRFSTKGVKLRVTVEVAPAGGVTEQEIEETRTALKELGLGWGEDEVVASGRVFVQQVIPRFTVQRSTDVAATGAIEAERSDTFEPKTHPPRGAEAGHALRRLLVDPSTAGSPCPASP